jgi:hypothetical protein
VADFATIEVEASLIGSHDFTLRQRARHATFEAPLFDFL